MGARRKVDIPRLSGRWALDSKAVFVPQTIPPWVSFTSLRPISVRGSGQPRSGLSVFTAPPWGLRLYNSLDTHGVDLESRSPPIAEREEPGSSQPRPSRPPYKYPQPRPGLHSANHPAQSPQKKPGWGKRRR